MLLLNSHNLALVQTTTAFADLADFSILQPTAQDPLPGHSCCTDAQLDPCPLF